MRHARSILAAIVAWIGIFGTAAFAQSSGAEPRVAMKGYDPVAYFTDGRPVRGLPQFAHDWDEGRYYFASATHRDMFAADPDRYAPRFAGHCTASLTRGAKNPGDPEAWAIVDGKLYLVGMGKGKEVAMAGVQRLSTDPTMIANAQKKWRELGR